MIDIKKYEEVFATIQNTKANELLNNNIDDVIAEHCTKLFGSIKSAYLLPDAIKQHELQIERVKAELEKQEANGETNQQIEHQLINLQKELDGMKSFQKEGLDSMKSHADLIIYLQNLKHD